MKETRIVRGVQVWDRKARQSVEIDLDVEIAVDLIGHELAAKAYNNRARRSRALHGLVEVRMRGAKITPLAALAKPLSAMADDR
jgi:hypothetical protein